MPILLIGQDDVHPSASRHFWTPAHKRCPAWKPTKNTFESAAHPGESDPDESDRPQHIDIQGGRLLSVHRVGSRHRTKASTSAQLASDQGVKGDQESPVEFLGNGRGGEFRHEVSCDCFSCFHTLQGSKETSRSPAYTGGLW